MSRVAAVADTDKFQSYAKCWSRMKVPSALEVIFNVMRSINPRFTYFYLLPDVGRSLVPIE